MWKNKRPGRSVLKAWFLQRSVCKTSLLLLHSSATSCLKELDKVSFALLSAPQHSPEFTHGLGTCKCLLGVLKLPWSENRLEQITLFYTQKLWPLLPSECELTAPCCCGQQTVQLGKSLSYLSTGKVSARGRVHMRTHISDLYRLVSETQRELFVFEERGNITTILSELEMDVQRQK